MPQSNLAVQPLDEGCSIEFDRNNHWATLCVTGGPRLNLSPESIRRLQSYLGESRPQPSHAISETYDAEMSLGGCLHLIVHHNKYSFSYAATQALRTFLNKVLTESQLGEEDNA